METALTPLDFARRTRRLHGSRVAVVDGDLRLSYDQFFDRCDRWAAALHELGVRHGDRVATIAPNTHGHLEAFYAVPQLGAVLVPVNYRLTPDDFVYIVNHCGATVVCADSDYLAAVDSVRSQLPQVRQFVALEGTAEGWLNYEAAIAGASPDFPRTAVDERDLLTINYTSGTTARPKGVMITHRNAAINSIGTLLHLPVSVGERFIAVCAPLPEHDSLSPADRAVAKSRQGVELLTSGELRVVDDANREVPCDAETLGEIVVRGNAVMAGYYRDPEATRRVMGDGWFHTGDAAVVHPDGYIEIRDRLKDVIISGGENISSVEVEGTLLRHPAVQEAAIVGMPDDRWGEVPVAFVVLREGASATEAELIAFARERLAHFKTPRGVTLVTELPKTATGKIQKYALRGGSPSTTSSLSEKRR